MKGIQLYALYAELCATLSQHECESCGGPAQHVDRDGGTFCFECIESDTETPTGVVYPGTKPGVTEEDDES